MKKTAIILLLLLFVCTACKKENNPLNKIKEATDKVKEVKQGFSNLEKIADSAEDMQENIEKLAEATPISKETIKSWMPENLGDLNRSKYDIGKQMGFAQISNAHLVFKNKGNSKGVDVTIIDGAGNGASVIAMNNLVLQVDMDSESETGYKRTETFDDQKVMVDYSSPEYANRTLFKYIINNRLYVEAKGWQMKPVELWEYLKKLDIGKLIN